MKKNSFLFLLLFLAGCGTFSSVRISYNLPDNSNPVETKKALGSLYLLFRVPPTGEESSLGLLAGAMLKQDSYDINAALFARKLASVFSERGATVLTYRVSRDNNKNEPYLPFFEPSGMLEVKLSQPQVSVNKEERRKDHYDKAGQKQTVKSVVWVYKAEMDAGVKLISYPEQKTLDKWTLPLERVEERVDNGKDAAEWYEENSGWLSSQAVDKLVERYLNRQILRYRPLARKKNDKESSEAVSLGVWDRWPEAEGIWARRLKESGDWRDYLNLGVASEVKKDFAVAKDYYSKAREKAGGDKDAKKILWNQIFTDLEVMLSMAAPSAPGRGDWFSPKMAVLPFSDETTSIDGPIMVRGLIYNALKESGYNMLSLEETDSILQSHGYTQGGQLGAAKNRDLCKWLGADRLFFGDITNFNEVMAGIYNKREIKGQFSLWDRKTGKQLWAYSGSVVKVSAPKNFLKGMLTQLANKMLESIKKKPLAYEASIFSSQTAENLPAKVNR